MVATIDELDIYGAMSRATLTGEEGIAKALTRMAVNTGDVVIAYKAMTKNSITSIMALISASKSYCQQVSVVTQESPTYFTFATGTYNIRQILSSQDYELLCGLLAVSDLDTALSVDIKSQGIMPRIGRLDGGNIQTEDRPYLVFIIMLPYIIDDLVEKMKDSIRQARDLQDRLQELVGTHSSSSSLSKL